MEKADEGGAVPLAPLTEADLAEILRSLAPALACGSALAHDTLRLVADVRALRKRVAVQEQAMMERAIEHDDDMQEMRRHPPPVHAHGSDDWNAACADCQRESWVFERNCREQEAAAYKAEIGRLQDAWFCDETIAPDGNLRALVSRTVARAEEAEALLFKIHRLSDPNRITSGEPPAGPSSTSNHSQEGRE